MGDDADRAATSRGGIVAGLVLAGACACGGADLDAAQGAPTPPAAAVEAPPGAAVVADTPRPDAPGVEPEAPAPTMRVRFLGVGGFLVEVGDDAVLTAPLLTRPSMTEVMVGEIASDPSLVDGALTPAELARAKAVLSGHAHYDHLLDVPSVMARAPSATLYTNASARHLMAALAPDRDTRCANTPAPSSTLSRSRVVALDDPAASKVDYRSCPELRPAAAPLAGEWTMIPGANARVMAFGSEHPDQFGPVHFGPGDVDEDACTLPKRAADWKEGRTLAFLVDFLDPKTGAPRFRLFYQDAPTDAPVGHVPAAVLAERRVDLALLCVGAYQNVDDAPRPLLGSMAPRFALGGHWEDFFAAPSAAPSAIPFTDVSQWEQRAVSLLAPGSEPKPWSQNGQRTASRVVVPMPGDALELSP
jgi:hypothetical protein